MICLSEPRDLKPLNHSISKDLTKESDLNAKILGGFSLLSCYELRASADVEGVF